MDPAAVNDFIYQVPLRVVNVFLMIIPDGLILIDTGPAGCKTRIFSAVRKLGYQPSDIKHIVVTHSHYDHAGGLADIVKDVKAAVYMHPVDADLVKKGVAYQFRSATVNDLIRLITLNGLIKLPRINIKPVENIIPVTEGDWIPGTDGLQVIYAPGHWPGQIALYTSKNGGLLMAADIAENHRRLKISAENHNLEDCMATIKKIAGMQFDTAIFSHGGPILSDASTIFKEVFGFN